MIRTVVAVLLTVAILGVAAPSIERGAAVYSENAVERQLTDVERASVSLVENEAVPPAGVRGPRRTITVSFPGDSLKSEAVASVRIERVDANFSVASYSVEGRTEQQLVVDAPIVDAEMKDVVTLGGTGERELLLELRTDDDGEPVVVLSRA